MTPKVITRKTGMARTIKINLTKIFESPTMAGTRIISINTLDNWLCARDNAHSRR
jgi:hypothetical protein